MWARLGNMNNKGNRDKCVEPPPEGVAVLGFPNFPYLRFSSHTTQKKCLEQQKGRNPPNCRKNENKNIWRHTMFIPRTFRKKNRNHKKLQPKRHLEITRPALLAKLSGSEFEPELFAHSAFDKFFVTFATNFLIRSPFPLHFLILLPFSAL